MKSWIKTINSKEQQSIEILNTIEFSFYDLPINILQKHQAKFDKEVHRHLLQSTIKVSLFKFSVHNACVLINKENKYILINDFFYYTLVGRTLLELKAFIFYIHVSLNNSLPDLQIDIHEQSIKYKEQRKQKLSSEELSVLQINQKDDPLNIMALTYLGIVFKGSFEQLGSLEKKIIRDTLGISYAKKLLDLDDSAYKYIENPIDVNSKEYSDYQYEFQRINEEIESKKIFFEDFVHSYLENKNMLVWTWWTISPFISADLSILLPIISGAKTIKKIYIDLCPVSEHIFEKYINDHLNDERIIENEVKKIYPPILKDYQKETLPYMILLEKIKMLSIPIKCFGLNGLELMGKEPYLNNKNQLEYFIDNNWKRSLFEEYNNLSNYKRDEVIIFFQFMKPMCAVPENLKDDRIEKIIHTDKFTGYGPDKPENSLSVFSRFSSKINSSFVIPNISDSTLGDEPIVFFPHINDASFPKFDDSHFNRFNCYDSMVYSSFSGGGGSRNTVETPSPFIFEPTL